MKGIISFLIKVSRENFSRKNGNFSVMCYQNVVRMAFKNVFIITSSEHFLFIWQKITFNYEFNEIRML